MIRKSLLFSLLAAVISFPVFAQPKLQLGSCVIDQELTEPPELHATGGTLSTTLDVVWKTGVPVQVWSNNGGVWQCAPQTINLRQYSFTDDTGKVVTGFPGPTLRIRKPSSPNGVGDALKIKLVNDLPYASDDKCNDPCPATGAQCSTGTYTLPNCFHGNNTTNLHFHGLHVSPQAPQDYVLLSLEPRPPVGSNPPAVNAHAHEGTVASGSYQYAVDPLRWTQPDGTDWYHPHKHGSTALQVGNGMAGALIVEGPFDDWLRGWYATAYKEQKTTLTEKVMVLQQVHDLNFTTATPAATSLPLINGLTQPHVTMRPGEVQRWRLIGATMEASAQLQLDFSSLSTDGTTKVAQIAMDGVQFSPDNYDAQPMMQSTVPGGPPNTFRLSPGNRADFLVQAPVTPGVYKVRFQAFGRIQNQALATRLSTPGAKRKLKGGKAPQHEDLPDFLKAIAAATGGTPVLLTIVVDNKSCGTNCPVMAFPPYSDWPKMPDYLADIERPGKKENLQFDFLPKPGAAPGVQPQTFAISINNNAPKQYTSQCVDFSPAIGTTEEWTLSQNQPAINNTPFHVFHIHTNAFQLMTLPPARPGHKPPEPVWMDSITLPNSGNVVIRQRFEEFTGQFVLHCHFLGHEDRGMMLGVQTVCPNGKFGYATPGGTECREGNYFNAMPVCPPVGQAVHKTATTKKKAG